MYFGKKRGVFVLDNWVFMFNVSIKKHKKNMILTEYAED